VSATLDYQRPVSHGLQHYKETGHKIINDAAGQAITGPFDVPNGVGKAHKHLAADLQVSGEAKYLDDMEGGLYGGMVMSSKSRARIKSVDPSMALKLEGVHGYFDHKDVEGSNAWGAIIWDEEVFATTDVYTTGQPIGIIVADSHALARKAAGLVKVEYEVLDAILTIEEAIAADSFIGDPAVIQRGDAAGVLASAKNVVEGEVRIGGQEHFYLETQASMVVPGESDEFTVYASTQNPTKTSNFVAAAIGVPKNKVVCKVKRMGGGFGGKETRSVYLSMALAVAAQKTGKAVRCMLDRDTDMCTAGQRHPFLLKYKVAYSDDGMLLAADCYLFANGGFSMDLSRPVLDRALFHVENAYNIPNLRVTGRVCRTNLPSNTAFRGFGGPQGIVSAETYVEHVARALGRPPEEIREKNLYASRGAVTHYKQELVDCHIREMWGKVKETSDFATRRAAVDAFNESNRWKKRGLSMMPVKFGMSFTAKFMNQASALVHVYTDGTVLVSHGGTEMGQGLHTKMCQIAAAELGVPLDKVFIAETATDKCANTHPTAASVGADLNGFAVQDACKQITARLEKFRLKDPTMSFKDIAMAAWLDRVDLSAHGFYKTPDLGFDFNTGEGRAFHYHAYGVAACEVELDVLSGDFQTLRADILHDVGDSLNPAIDIGQVEGAFVQGLGLFTLEEMVWLKNGQLFTRGPSTYKVCFSPPAPWCSE
jgi:xanthine dehydrogenase/oxidase